MVKRGKVECASSHTYQWLSLVSIWRNSGLQSNQEVWQVPTDLFCGYKVLSNYILRSIELVLCSLLKKWELEGNGKHPYFPCKRKNKTPLECKASTQTANMRLYRDVFKARHCYSDFHNVKCLKHPIANEVLVLESSLEQHLWFWLTFIPRNQNWSQENPPRDWLTQQQNRWSQEERKS